jgi:hypothetical protein
VHHALVEGISRAITTPRDFLHPQLFAWKSEASIKVPSAGHAAKELPAEMQKRMNVTLCNVGFLLHTLGQGLQETVVPAQTVLQLAGPARVPGLRASAGKMARHPRVMATRPRRGPVIASAAPRRREPDRRRRGRH